MLVQKCDVWCLEFSKRSPVEVGEISLKNDLLKSLDMGRQKQDIFSGFNGYKLKRKSQLVVKRVSSMHTQK